jgi:electron transport complex protein RnfB
MIAESVLILGGTGLVFAAFIAVANRKLKVWEDPRIDMVASLLPQANCGACGLPGCRAFAERAVQGTIQPAKCTVSEPSRVKEIAAYLGVDAGEGIKRVARLRCAGGSDVAIQRASYRGLQPALPLPRWRVAARDARGGASVLPIANAPAPSMRSA